MDSWGLCGVEKLLPVQGWILCGAPAEPCFSAAEVLSQPGCISTWSWHVPSLTQLCPGARHAPLAERAAPAVSVHGSGGRESLPSREDGAEMPYMDH